MYHNAVVNTSWYNDNLEYLTDMVKDIVKTNDIIVDFGAGTGVSSLVLLNSRIKDYKIFLVDNSPSWLSKAYEILKDRPNVDFFILEKKDGNYSTLAQTIGNGKANIVISANTFHLVPDLNVAFKGIYDSLQKKSTFIMQSGNITRKGRAAEVLMIDDTVEKIHNLAVDILKTDKKYSIYAKNLNKLIEEGYAQRKMIFPDPRPVEIYINALELSGFRCDGYTYKEVKVKYTDWKNFLKVKRIQAGILPEIGGKNPTEKEINIRDSVITQAIDQLFMDIKRNNSKADESSFTAEWVYIKSLKED
ncbi:MAG: methyltransferase domain-containing protein [Candidatus Omnitrophota bacterium]